MFLGSNFGSTQICQCGEVGGSKRLKWSCKIYRRPARVHKLFEIPDIDSWGRDIETLKRSDNLLFVLFGVLS